MRRAHAIGQAKHADRMLAYRLCRQVDAAFGDPAITITTTPRVPYVEVDAQSPWRPVCLKVVASEYRMAAKHEAFAPGFRSCRPMRFAGCGGETQNRSSAPWPAAPAARQAEARGRSHPMDQAAPQASA